MKFIRKPKQGGQQGRQQYRACGAPMSVKEGNKVTTVGRCIRPAGHSGGHSNVRTD